MFSAKHVCSRPAGMSNRRCTVTFVYNGVSSFSFFRTTICEEHMKTLEYIPTMLLFDLNVIFSSIFDRFKYTVGSTKNGDLVYVHSFIKNIIKLSFSSSASKVFLDCTQASKLYCVLKSPEKHCFFSLNKLCLTKYFQICTFKKDSEHSLVLFRQKDYYRDWLGLGDDGHQCLCKKSKFQVLMAPPNKLAFL